MVTFKHPNGAPDTSGHDHAWWDPGDREFFTHGEFLGGRVICSAWKWCCLCGALGDMSNLIIYLPSFQYGKNDRRPNILKEGYQDVIKRLRHMAGEIFMLGKNDSDAKALRLAATALEAYYDLAD